MFTQRNNEYGVVKDEFDFPPDFKELLRDVQSKISSIKKNIINQKSFSKKKEIIVKPLVKPFITNLTIDRVLVCPIGVNYFYTFLQKGNVFLKIQN
jgi:hypothetical protein